VIYLDTSIALAYLLTEDRSPPESIWQSYEERLLAGARALHIPLYLS
jgi:hypothetical protein